MDKRSWEEIIIEKTLDGSDTLYVPSLDEHYHSINGAIQESNHVFIEAGLRTCLEHKILNILEIGFGTGLNAYLTLKEALHYDVTINYITIELYPLPIDIIQNLNYSQVILNINQKLFFELHKADWNNVISIHDRFSILKLEGDIIQIIPNINKKFDLIYFDAFSPEKQPELWSQAIFDNIYSLTKEGGLLTTYCAKGIVRRMLQKSGYQVERLPGPPGKREMLKCFKYLNLN